MIDPPRKTLQLAFLVIFYKSVSLQMCSPLEFGTVWNFIFLTTDKDVLLERHQREKERETGGR